MPSSRPSGSVIAAGIVAIVGSSLVVLGQCFALFGLFLVKTLPASQNLPAPMKTITFAVLFFFIAIAIFGIFTGIGILRLRNWARISALVWAGVTVFFISVSLLFLVVMPFPDIFAPPSLPDVPAAPPVPMLAVKALLFVFYSIPLGIGIWWLVLFNHKRIGEQFAATSVPTTTSVLDQPKAPVHPRCPLPVAVIAGYLLFSFATVLVLPLLHFPLPVILFGRRIHGSPGFSIFLFTAVLLAFVAIGLLRLKRWSYPLLLGLQLFWLASGTITFLGPNYQRQMQEALDEMPFPQSGTSVQFFLHSRSWAIAALLPSMAVVIFLLYYRDRFMKAVEDAEQAKLNSTAA
jgi:hypothetical protein